MERSLPPIRLDDGDEELELRVGRALFRWSQDAMLLGDPHTGAILDANPAAARMFDKSADEICGENLAALVNPADADVWTAARAERHHTGSFVGEVPMCRGDGNVFTAQITSAIFTAGHRQYALTVLRDVTDYRTLERHLREAFEQMSRLATVDELTGLLNRRGFITVGHQLAANARRERRSLVVLVADVDGLKSVNDEFGHSVGDQMLCDVAAELSSNLREADVVARIGGDEFAVILADAQAGMHAQLASGRINADLRQRAEAEGRPYVPAVSAGIAVGAPAGTYDLEELLRAADEQMYAVKVSHRRPLPPVAPSTPQHVRDF